MFMFQLRIWYNLKSWYDSLVKQLRQAGGNKPLQVAEESAGAFGRFKLMYCLKKARKWKN